MRARLGVRARPGKTSKTQCMWRLHGRASSLKILRAPTIGQQDEVRASAVRNACVTAAALVIHRITSDVDVSTQDVLARPADTCGPVASFSQGKQVKYYARSCSFVMQVCRKSRVRTHPAGRPAVVVEEETAVAVAAGEVAVREAVERVEAAEEAARAEVGWVAAGGAGGSAAGAGEEVETEAWVGAVKAAWVGVETGAWVGAVKAAWVGVVKAVWVGVVGVVMVAVATGLCARRQGDGSVKTCGRCPMPGPTLSSHLL